MECKKGFCLIAALIGLAGCSVHWRSASDDYDASVVNDDRTAFVRLNHHQMSLYCFEQVPYKPYFKELRTPDGINVLLDAPSDHLHHHGLMFALAVDGVDFWGETEGCGRQQHRSISTIYYEIERTLKGTFIESLDWQGPDNSTMLLEKRTMETRADSDVTLLTWKSELRPPEGKGSVTIDGRHYFGLGMRFVEEMNNTGPFLNADNAPGTIYRGQERLVRSRWCAYQSHVDGRPVTVVIFDHPDNPRPATWFTMAEPFAYMSATLAYHENPIQLPKDQTLTLQYGVALWDGHINPDQIENKYKQWLQWTEEE
ncbi:MAG: PmoA family protein [Sedimentisphaerales bacterium]|nr:PmoA family protein [Sedimentisphaerales bacterium]